MTAQYTYLATDLVTGQVLGELPVNNVSLDCQLNSAGNMSSGLRMDDPRLDNDELIARTYPGRTAFWAYRENTIVWGGMVLSRQYQSDGKSISLTGQTFEAYAYKRYPRLVLGGSGVSNFVGGQCEAIDFLWSQLQSITDGYIGVQRAAVPPVDNQTTLTVNGYDLSTSYGKLMDSIVALDSGPDWTITWVEDSNGLPQKQLVVGAPIGNGVGVSDLVVDYPGPVKNYNYTENASSGGNTWWAVGDGNGAAAIVGVAQDLNSLGSGYPLWEEVNSYSGVTDQGTINSHASGDLTASPLPLVTHAAELSGGDFPMFGTYGLGDYIVVNVLDTRFPDPGIQFALRAVGWSIQPPDESSGEETINLVFAESAGANS